MNTVEKTFGDLTVDSIAPGLNGKKNQAQLRQVVTTIYPSARVGNSHSDSIFSENDFGFEEGQSFESTRVGWMDVPLNIEGKKGVKEVEKLLAKFPKAKLYRVLSLEPILTSEQRNWMMNLDTKTEREDFLALIKERQSVKNSDGDIVPYKGQTQYAVNYFSKEGKADIDTRDNDLVVQRGELIPADKKEVAKEATSF